MLEWLKRAGLAQAEAGRLPDHLLRRMIRWRHQATLHAECPSVPEEQEATNHAFVDWMRTGPVVEEAETANRQHYALPPPFFELMLGPRLKYSGCLWPADREDGTSPARPVPDKALPTLLPAAEEAMLRLSCERAGVEDGMRVLDLGCGWGSLGLWIAQQYPNCSVTAVSNSAPQGIYIRRRATAMGLTNIEHVKANVAGFAPQNGSFERIVSVEMVEHVRGWPELFARMARWLTPDGAAFLHFFSHADCAYRFRSGPDDWMGRHFFTAGIMPSHDLPQRIGDHLEVDSHWRVNGTHYQRTLDAWLANLDARGELVRPVLAEAYGAGDARLWFHRWRIFLLACSELFGFGGGEVWQVSHYRLTPRR